MTDIEPRFQFTPANSPAMPKGAVGGNLILRGSLTKEIAAEIRKLDFARVVLDYGMWPDLTPLRGRPIQQMLVYGTNIDWESICSLGDLASLQITGDARLQFDSALLSRLRFLSAFWTADLERDMRGSESLEALELRGPVPPLKQLPAFARLKALRIIQSPKLLSLDGIDQFKAMEYAEFSHCGKLASVGDLRACTRLECLNLLTCNKLHGLGGLSGAPALRELALGLGEVESLSGLAKSQSIEKLRFDCKVADGDLDFLFRMPALKFCLFKNAKNFNHKVAEVQAFLEDKGFVQKPLRDSLRRFPFAGDYAIA